MAFLKNIVGGVAKAVQPLVNTVAPIASFIPGVGPIAGAISAADNAAVRLTGGGEQAGEQQGFAPQRRPNPLGEIIGAVGPAVATNALSKADWSAAEQMMNNAFKRMQGATSGAIDAYKQDAANLGPDPALAGSGPAGMVDPTAFSGVRAPQVGGVNGAAPWAPQAMSYAPSSYYRDALRVSAGMPQAAPTAASPFGAGHGAPRTAGYFQRAMPPGANEIRYDQPGGGGANPVTPTARAMFGLAGNLLTPGNPSFANALSAMGQAMGQRSPYLPGGVS